MVKDPVFAGSDGGLAIAIDADESDWEKLDLLRGRGEGRGERSSGADLRASAALNLDLTWSWTWTWARTKRCLEVPGETRNNRGDPRFSLLLPVVIEVQVQVWSALPSPLSPLSSPPGGRVGGPCYHPDVTRQDESSPGQPPFPSMPLSPGRGRLTR